MVSHVVVTVTISGSALSEVVALTFDAPDRPGPAVVPVEVIVLSDQALSVAAREGQLTQVVADRAEVAFGCVNAAAHAHGGELNHVVDRALVAATVRRLVKRWQVLHRVEAALTASS